MEIGAKIRVRCLKMKLCSCGLFKRNCPKHSPSLFCPCKILIATCEKCLPHRLVCPCGKSRGLCPIHGGWLSCVCGSGRHKSRCTKCGSGHMLCEHKRRRNNCMVCLRLCREKGQENQYLTNNGEICSCAIPRKFCAKHGGSHLCISCRVTTTRVKCSECSACRRHREGDTPRKKHEFSMKKEIDRCVDAQELVRYTSCDKCATVGLDPLLYGSSRPDFLWKLETHWVILEVDESQHRGMSYSCERRRELDLYNTAGGLPVTFVRFNPDAFKTGSKSSRVKHKGDQTILRHRQVMQQVKKAIKDTEQTGITFVKVFFDCDCMAENGKHLCEFVHVTKYHDHESFLMSFQES